jgi:PAS domain S-box-containing protein
MLRLSPRKSALSTDSKGRSAGLNLGPLFDLTADALVVQDVATGRIALWNRAAEQLFGYSRDEAVGQPIAMLLPPAVARLHQERLAHFTRSGEADVLTGRDALQIPAIQQGGEEIRVELSTAPIEPDEPRHILLTFRDARSNKRAELQALELAHAEAALSESEARLTGRDRLLVHASREIDGALRRLRRSTARLRSASLRGNRARLEQAARVVDARAEMAERAVRDLVDAAALEAGTFELSLERTNLVPFFTQLTAAARRRAQAHQLKLGLPQGLTATIDVARLLQVIDAVIDDAVRRNPRGCWIDVDLKRPLGGLARIEIRDYGRPLSARECAALPGGGATSRQWALRQAIVAHHGGKLCIEMVPEGGCRVVISLSTNGGRVTA